MRLHDAAATFDKTLPSGVVVTLRPLSGPLYQAAQFAASNRARSDEGWPEGLDRANEGHRLGVGLSMLAQEYARLSVVAWTGIDDAECTPDNAALLAERHPLDGEAIRTAVTQRAAAASVEAKDEGNG